MGQLANLTTQIAGAQEQPSQFSLPLIMNVATSTTAVRTVEDCLPGYAQQVPWPYQPTDLVGLYEYGKEIVRQLGLAEIPDEVIRLLHPNHILPVLTYRRMYRFTASTPATGVVYGVSTTSVAYGPGVGAGGAVENVAYGPESGGGTPGEEFLEFLYDQIFENNKRVPIC